MDDTTLNLIKGSEPPVPLSKAERAKWDKLLSQVDESHFVASDGPLIVQYIRAFEAVERNAVLVERAPATIVTANSTLVHPVHRLHDQLVNRMAVLASALRLTPIVRRTTTTKSKLRAHRDDLVDGQVELRGRRTQKSRAPGLLFGQMAKAAAEHEQ